MDNTPDTNMLEVKKLLHSLVTNGYKLERIREAVSVSEDAYNIYPDDAIADFSKEFEYNDTYGNHINDSIIKVSIHFEKRADYKNFKIDEEGNNVYGNPKRFIKGLIKEIKRPESVKRKTHKNHGTQTSDQNLL